MNRETKLVAAAITIIMKYGCSTFDDCSACPLCQYQGMPGVLGDLCNSIERVCDTDDK